MHSFGLTVCIKTPCSGAMWGHAVQKLKPISKELMKTYINQQTSVLTVSSEKAKTKLGPHTLTRGAMSPAGRS